MVQSVAVSASGRLTTPFIARFDSRLFFITVTDDASRSTVRFRNGIHLISTYIQASHTETELNGDRLPVTPNRTTCYTYMAGCLVLALMGGCGVQMLKQKKKQ